jgi:aminoglycoside phosphotransferase
MEKELGFYMDDIEPRFFNSIEQTSLEIITKKSKDLSGEIYYYKNTPASLKHLFPLLVGYDENNKWFKIEKISGLALSNLYLSELLKEHELINVMNVIHTLHSTEFIDTDNINIYENYYTKLKERYENYDYSAFNDSNTVYKELLEKLKVYESQDKGHKSIIHGDSVFTNILVNNNEQIKFIDMRGKIGKKLTIYGDNMYDWAKLYQSLVGYDRILLDKYVTSSYENKMKAVFEKRFLELHSIEDFDNLKLITKSLLFSLIPLHNNEKCFKYYELINKI